VRARDTGEIETVECGMVLRSIGYLGTGIEGIPHDPRRGVIPNKKGRVVDDNEHELPGLYVVGWIKRGPSGVIGTNKKDAAETVEAIFEDVEAGSIPERETSPEALPDLLRERDVPFVEYDGWQAIDELETARGTEQGRPRVKITSVDEMIAASNRR
jgi:ferredoxin--NADP+ reductase